MIMMTTLLICAGIGVVAYRVGKRLLARIMRWADEGVEQHVQEALLLANSGADSELDLDEVYAYLDRETS